VWAQIDELPASAKPARVRESGKAHLRSYDGDYELSQLEEQAFVANRTSPRFDGDSIESATIADLDPEMIRDYIESCRSSSVPLSRFTDETILVKTGVLAPDRTHPTVAGLLALGSYPQQFFPNLVIQASVDPDETDPVGTRAVDARRFDGPIPVMLDEALRWVQRNTRTRLRFGPDGHGRDEPEYPAEAVRELLSNALVHRDLGPYALNQAITLKLQQGKLVVHNPGGLFGVSASQLGKVEITSARNGYLIRICQNVRSGRDRRVVEALATGIKTVLKSVAAAGMVPPRFHDRGIGFTVVMPNHALLSLRSWPGLPRFPEQQDCRMCNGMFWSQCETAANGPTAVSARSSPWTQPRLGLSSQIWSTGD
jgi:ATP-dependent DNA helicase RecG